MKKKDLKVNDCAICINNNEVKHLTVGRIYIKHKDTYDDLDLIYLKNDNNKLYGYYLFRFRKATKEEIYNNMADITYRKCLNEI